MALAGPWFMGRIQQHVAIILSPLLSYCIAIMRVKVFIIMFPCNCIIYVNCIHHLLPLCYPFPGLPLHFPKVFILFLQHICFWISSPHISACLSYWVWLNFAEQDNLCLMYFPSYDIVSFFTAVCNSTVYILFFIHPLCVLTDIQTGCSDCCHKRQGCASPLCTFPGVEGLDLIVSIIQRLYSLYTLYGNNWFTLLTLCIRVLLVLDKWLSG